MEALIGQGLTDRAEDRFRMAPRRGNKNLKAFFSRGKMGELALRGALSATYRFFHRDSFAFGKESF